MRGRKPKTANRVVAGAVTMLVAVFACEGMASAHDNSVAATARCVDGDASITWTVTNDYDMAETASATAWTGEYAGSIVTPASIRIARSGSGTFEQKLVGGAVSESASLTVRGQWSDGFVRTDVGEVTVPGGCGAATTTTTAPPRPTTTTTTTTPPRPTTTTTTTPRRPTTTTTTTTSTPRRPTTTTTTTTSTPRRPTTAGAGSSGPGPTATAVTPLDPSAHGADAVAIAATPYPQAPLQPIPGATLAHTGEWFAGSWTCELAVAGVGAASMLLALGLSRRRRTS